MNAWDPSGQVPNQGEQFNPYAAPVSQTPAFVGKPPEAGDGLWRDGDKLVAAIGASFPPYCVKCNDPADQMPMRKYTWYHPALAFILLASPIIFIIVVLIVQKKANFNIGVCARHRQQRLTKMLLVWLIGLPLSIGMGVFGFSDESLMFLIPLAIVLFVIVLAVGITVARYLRPVKITDTHAWFKGVDPTYLNRLPHA